ncbi:MAG: prepilin-type N-terminal cleavage/methylation domain-containing protein [Dictyoglomus sp.]|nr:prepilin-type N-terminal cleavage/methylation domain-containing protein [Dictyoglomus sp.]MDW8187901.1 prepilin-type N-terminal cleavage/methylation domain-containing protein [Dictyoglomus sp.]
MYIFDNFKKTSKEYKNMGFSIIEVLVVILILGIIIGIGVPVYYEILLESKRNTQKYNMKLIKEALEVYYLRNKSYPIDAWSFTTFLLYNPLYFSETLICPYNNKPYNVIQWQDYYTDWDDIWNWVESSRNYNNIYYKSENPTYSYALTYYSR